MVALRHKARHEGKQSMAQWYVITNDGELCGVLFYGAGVSCKYIVGVLFHVFV